MATYTAFMGALRPGLPGTYDSITYYYPIYADVLLLNAAGHPVMVGGSTGPWAGFLPLSSTESIEPSDTIATLRQKVMNNLRPQYPQLSASDTIKVVWLDNGGLLSL